jgi:aromatic-L-amino-acid decarboxylase
MQEMVDAAMQRVVRHLSVISELPAAVTEGGAALARELREELPRAGAPLDDALSLLFDRALDVTFNTASPGYLAYIPGGGVFPAAVADLIAGAINRYVGVWVAAPGLVQIEANVVRWFNDLVGLGPGAGGFLTTGGSLANLSAIVAARQHVLGDRFDDGVLYCSTQTHNSIEKAARIAGFRRDQLRVLDVDDNFRLAPSSVAAAVKEDRAAGRRPFLLVANAGSTNTGAVDELAALADVAGDESLWFHVDAAYGGFFLLTERGRGRLGGIERADSVTLDPHKGLFLPYGNGCLLVRDPQALRRAHSSTADYLPDMQTDADLVDFCEISPELSRDFRGLRVWLPLKLWGADAFAATLDEKLDLARAAASALRDLGGVEIVAEPELSLFAFRHERDGDTREERNARNRRWMDAINARGRVYLTGTTVNGGDFVLRVCVLHFRTHADRMAVFLDDARETLAELEREA